MKNGIIIGGVSGLFLDYRVQFLLDLAENQIVGNFVADVIVEDSVILELKFIRRLAKIHEIQLVNYLAATGKMAATVFQLNILAVAISCVIAVRRV